MRGRRVVVVEPPVPKAEASRCEAGRETVKAGARRVGARVPANQLQREQAQLEAEFESLSDAARTVEARVPEDVSRLAAQFATRRRAARPLAVALYGRSVSGRHGESGRQGRRPRRAGGVAAGDAAARLHRRAELPRGAAAASGSTRVGCCVSRHLCLDSASRRCRPSHFSEDTSGARTADVALLTRCSACASSPRSPRSSNCCQEELAVGPLAVCFLNGSSARRFFGGLPIKRKLCRERR